MMELYIIEAIKQYRSDLSELSNEAIESTFEDHRTKILQAALQIIDNDDYLKDNQFLQSQCLKELSSLVVFSFMGSYDNSKISSSAMTIIDDYEKKAINFHLDDIKNKVIEDKNPKILFPVFNEMDFRQKNSISSVSHLELEPLLNFKLNRFKEFFTQTKEYLKDKIDYPVNVYKSIPIDGSLFLDETKTQSYLNVLKNTKTPVIDGNGVFIKGINSKAKSPVSAWLKYLTDKGGIINTKLSQETQTEKINNLIPNLSISKKSLFTEYWNTEIEQIINLMK